MASISANGSRGHHKFTLNVNETYVSGGADNYSDVSWDLILEPIQRGWDWYYSATVPVKYSVNIDGTIYEGNIMSYDGQSTVTVASNSKRIYHNSDGSKSINFSFSVWDNVSANYLPGSASNSGSMNLTTIPRYANITYFNVSQRDETSVQFNWGADAVCDWAWYSVDGGSNWYNLPSNNIVSGLSAGTTYNFKLKIRRTDSQLTTESGIVQKSTYPYPFLEYAYPFTIGQNINIYLFNPLNRTINIYILGNDNSVICTATRNIDGSTSIASTVQEIDSQYASIPNSNVGNYKVRLVVSSLSRDTTVNGAEYRTNTDNCKPTFSDFTFEDVNATTIALTGNNQNIINRYSNVKAIITALNKATAQKYATMSKYSFVCGNSQTNINYNSSETVEGTINGVKSGVFNVYAIDSRTNSTVVTKIANEVIEYNDLIKNSINISRQNGVSETTSLSIYGKIDLVDFGQVVNSIQSAKYRYKATDSQTWSNYTNITLTVDSNGNFSFNGNIQGDTNDGFDIANSYNIEVVVSDELSSVIFTANLNSGVPNIALHKNGVGIMGKYDTSAGGPLQINGILPIETGTNSVGNYFKFYDGTLICTGKFTITPVSYGVVTNYKALPMHFIDNNYIMSFTAIDGNPTTYSTYKWAQFSYSSYGYNQFQINLYNSSNNTNTLTLSYIAIGKWK